MIDERQTTSRVVGVRPVDESGSKLWFCRWDKRFEIGPLNDEELLSMVVAGRIKPDDEVRRGWLGPWFLVSQVSGLAASPQNRLSAASAATQIPPVPPPLPVSHLTLATESNLTSGNVWHRDPRARIAIALVCLLVLLTILRAGLFAWSHKPVDRNRAEHASVVKPSATTPAQKEQREPSHPIP